MRNDGWRLPVIYDTIIVGGGIGGLQTAIQLARSLRRVAVVDIPGGRSMIAKGYRNLLGFPEGISGESLRQLGREQAAKYGAVFVEEEVISLRSEGDRGFFIYTKSASSPLHARTLVMATGIRDPFPDLPGIHECLGVSVFLCPDCDGYETVGQKVAVIGALPQAIGMADELAHYTTDIVVVNHEKSPVEDDWRQELQEKGFMLVDECAEEIICQGGAMQGLRFRSGHQLEVTRAFLAIPGAKVQTGLLQGFSVRLNPKGHVLTNPRTKETDHPNVWAVGDIGEHSQQVAVAMGDGALAAIWIQKRLRELDAKKRR